MLAKCSTYGVLCIGSLLIELRIELQGVGVASLLAFLIFIVLSTLLFSYACVALSVLGFPFIHADFKPVLYH